MCRSYVVDSLPNTPSPNPVFSKASTPGVVFSTDVPLQPITNPRLVSYDRRSLEEIGVKFDSSSSSQESKTLSSYLSGSAAIPKSRPSAHCYCGHQFGSFSGQLGDGATMYLCNTGEKRSGEERSDDAASNPPFISPNRHLLRSLPRC